MSPVEWAAAGFGLLAVGLTTRQSVWCWPAGLAQVLLYIPVFLAAKLYSDVVLHVVYVGLQLLGWWRWHRGVAGRSLPVTLLTPVERLIWFVAGAAGEAVVGGLMAWFTDAALPYWDAGILSFSLVATYLTTVKKLESWLVWMAVDVVGVGVYWVKELYPTVGLYAVFFVLCVYGVREWERSRRRPPG